MMWLLFIGFIVAALVMFDIVVISQSKKHAYMVWKREFEMELSSPEKVDEIIIRELYDSTMTPKAAVEYYLIVQSNLQLGEAIKEMKMEMLTLDECIERYSLNEEQISILKRKIEISRKEI